MTPDLPTIRRVLGDCIDSLEYVDRVGVGVGGSLTRAERVVRARALLSALGDGATLPVVPTLPPTVPEGFVRVRIAVAVDAAGKWAAHGYPDCDEVVLDGDLEPGDRVTWVLADVPMPQPAADVVGTVETT